MVKFCTPVLHAGHELPPWRWLPLHGAPGRGVPAPQDTATLLRCSRPPAPAVGDNAFARVRVHHAAILVASDDCHFLALAAQCVRVLAAPQALPYAALPTGAPTHAVRPAALCRAGHAILTAPSLLCLLFTHVFTYISAAAAAHCCGNAGHCMQAANLLFCTHHVRAASGRPVRRHR